LNKSPLEIERKFWFDFDIEKRLVDIGAKQIGNKAETRITDEYYDNFDSRFMLLNDYLLRKRIDENEDKWQLKYRSASQEDRSILNIEQYYEVVDRQKIVDAIVELASRKTCLLLSERCDSIASLIDSFKLKCYARIRSTRKSYIYENLRIDLDETDFGYKLGEIEIILDDSRPAVDLNAQIEKINTLTLKLGLF